jgi:hypothetical protein
MKSLRLLAAALVACGCTASVAIACDAHKTAKGKTATAATTASAATATKSTTKGAKHAEACTPEMAAACESNAAVAAAMGCAPATATTAVAASNAKSAKPVAKGDACCMSKGSKSSTTAVTAANAPKAASADHCADKSATAVVAAGTMKCAAHGHAVAHECSACEDWTACEQEVVALGARAQVVALKNGAMIVYTAESPAEVKALQTAIGKRHEKMAGAYSGTSGKILCPECKALRGAMASGKLHREIVNVERGCMTLITSNDRDVVTKIRAMTGQPVAMR